MQQFSYADIKDHGEQSTYTQSVPHMLRGIHCRSQMDELLTTPKMVQVRENSSVKMGLLYFHLWAWFISGLELNWKPTYYPVNRVQRRLYSSLLLNPQCPINFWCQFSRETFPLLTPLWLTQKCNLWLDIVSLREEGREEMLKGNLDTSRLQHPTPPPLHIYFVPSLPRPLAYPIQPESTHHLFPFY